MVIEVFPVRPCGSFSIFVVDCFWLQNYHLLEIYEFLLISVIFSVPIPIVVVAQIVVFVYLLNQYVGSEKTSKSIRS